MNNVALHIKKKKTHNSANHLYTQIQINITGKKESKTKELLTLFPSGLGTWAGVTLLGPEQAGSPGGAVLGLRALGRICQPISPPPRWTWTSCPPLHESTVSRSCGTLLQQN